MKEFDLDDRVVVVIGSGAGGGTVSNELAQQGIDVVCLEAGNRLSLAEIVNDHPEMDDRIGCPVGHIDLSAADRYGALRDVPCR